MNVERATKPAESGRFRLGAVIAVALAAGFVAWLVLRDNGGSASKGVGPKAASVGDLRDLATSLGHPVYWVGAKGGYTYELTRTAKDNVYIRYLPSGGQLGSRRAFYTTVGTYPFRNAYAVVKKMATNPGAISGKVPGGGFATISKARRSSAYLAYPGVNLEIEVFSPLPKQLRQLVFSGAVRPVQ